MSNEREYLDDVDEVTQKEAEENWMPMCYIRNDCEDRAKVLDDAPPEDLEVLGCDGSWKVASMSTRFARRTYRLRRGLVPQPVPKPKNPNVREEGDKIGYRIVHSVGSWFAIGGADAAGPWKLGDLPTKRGFLNIEYAQWPGKIKPIGMMVITNRASYCEPRSAAGLDDDGLRPATPAWAWFHKPTMEGVRR